MVNNAEYISSISGDTLKQESKDERLNSKEAVLNALTHDFPWFNVGDLDRAPTSGQVIDVNASVAIEENSVITDRRISTLYKDKNININIDGDLNDHERQYVQARSYARLCELSQTLRLVKSENSIHPTFNHTEVTKTLSTMSEDERKILAMETLANIETSLKNLLSPRWELEKKLFGHQLSDSTSRYFVEFASKSTFGPDLDTAVGKYTKAALELLSNLEVWSQDVNVESDKYQAYIEIIAEITSHEIGHEGNSSADKVYWESEEAWNQWKSVVLPRDLVGDNYKTYGTLRNGKVYSAQDKFILLGNAVHYAPHLYHSKIIKNETGELELSVGGAEGIAAMVEEVSQGLEPYGGTNEIKLRDKIYRIDREFVLKCALVSAYTRNEYGIYDYEGQDLLGFGSLYNQFAQARMHLLGEDTFISFGEKMEGSNDKDYYQFDPNLLSRN